MLLPLDRCLRSSSTWSSRRPRQGAELLLGEIRSRLRYLADVGLGYLTLDRQSRTLSGGEVQRSTSPPPSGPPRQHLFVLDEPSIGLHARDMQRVIGVLRRLRDAGNTLLVVEHDPEVMLAADRIVDLGPGPGEKGGEVVFFGTPAELLRSKRSLTGAYLSGGKTVAPAGSGTPPAFALSIEVLGAAEHNLKEIDVSIPSTAWFASRGQRVRKSTLVEGVLYNGIRKLKGKP